jgi:PEP-CTERM motif
MRHAKRLVGIVSAVAFATALAASPALAVHLDSPNRLVDPSFEGTLTADGPPFVGSWEGFSAGSSSSSAFTTNMPLSGVQSLELNIGPDINLFAGAFQDVAFSSSLAGQTAYYSGWHKANVPGGSEIRIEWRDSVANIEISRTPNLAPVIGTTYEEFIVSGIIPVGANTARVVYAIQSFSGVTNQQVFVDDVNFNAVPEPASFVLAALAGLALIGRRRRS